MRLTAIATAVLVLGGCSRTTEGPTPAVERVVNPRARVGELTRLCNAQGGATGWRLELQGRRFSPVPGEVLTDAPTVELPEVTLRGPSTYTLTREQVFYVRPELLLLDVPTRDSSPPVELSPGSYAVEVANPLGGTGRLPDALLVVEPPSVARVMPPADGYSAADSNPIVIEGQGFQPGTSPLLSLRREGVEDQPLFFVTVVSPTRVESELPPGTPEGVYSLVVAHGDGCEAVATGALDVRYPRLGTLTVSPRSGAERGDTTVLIRNTPTGAQRAFSAVPEVYIVAPVKSAPSQTQRIPLRSVELVSPQELRAVVPTCSGFDEPGGDPTCPGGIVVGGPYALEVLDPAGALGEVPATEGFTVVGGPGFTSEQAAPLDLPGAVQP
ncbi:hypothetical protein K8640_19355 [Myxococcus sp. XM-1-1-1]|uniref:hypothetical protein n=1 Tax=Myxococcus sp. XM-1-1-1 TaxID=2874602 RepID=UPI001CC0EA2D|nr:hypothetical protein [Myxococcus sp. XM-1-1-1]MBZ4410369.1 hypothetical protein [Myxococcus sp. XM-1-1-1]